MKHKNRLKVLRAEHDITQLDIAQRLHMHENRFWRIENGYSEPTPAERAALAKFFRVSESDVFPDEVRA